MRGNDISKRKLMYYWFLTGTNEIKRFFKRFTKKGREELSYEKMRFDQIREMIANYKVKE